MKKLYVVGDSTLAAFNDPYFYPRYGYGCMLKDYMKDMEIINLALSGRSSRSFLKEPNYEYLLKELKEGDFLLIGFGHNDEKKEDRLRFTDASLPHTNPNSFPYSLKEYYLKPCKEKGAIPILCTPICRLNEQDKYIGECVHQTSNGNYRDSILDLGQKTNTLVIDLTKETKKKYEALGYNKALYYHAIIAGVLDQDNQIKPNLFTVDKTHLNLFGAKFVAYLVASALKVSNHPLKEYIKKDIEEPTISCLKPNPNYEIKKYHAPNLKEYKPLPCFKTKTEGWYGTAFGASIGDISKSGFHALEQEKGHFIVGQTGAKLQGQLSLTTDGFAFCFRQIPVQKNFSLTAKAKVLTKVETKQTGFGIMLRDDCYINQEKASEPITSNYIASGLITTDTSMNPIFYKENVDLHKEEPIIEKQYQKQEEVFLKLIRIGQSVECYLEYQNKQYEKVLVDFDFLQIDQDYMYLGFFGTKGTLVEFFDVQFEVLGTAKEA